MPDLVRYEVNDRVAVLTIDNPPVNALAPAVWEAIDEAVAARGRRSGGGRDRARSAPGTTFIAGADIKVFEHAEDARASRWRDRRGRTRCCGGIEDSAKPLVAAIHGNALGGGLEVAQACHYRVAVADAKVGQPEVLLGIIPGAGGTQRLPRLAGAELALEMCTDGKPVAAPKAQAAGIIDEIVDGDLLAGAIAFAKAQGGGARDPQGRANRDRRRRGRARRSRPARRDARVAEEDRQRRARAVRRRRRDRSRR